MELLDYNYNTNKWTLNTNMSQGLKFYFNEFIEHKNTIVRVIEWSY